MHKFKKIMMFLFMLSLAVTIQFTFPACEDKKDDDSENIPDYTADVNEPTNDYTVIVQLMGFGSMGCGIGEVLDQNGIITDAEIKVNGLPFEFDDEMDAYSESSGNLSYNPGTSYTLEVNRGGEVIATGTARMPTVPTITEPALPYQHALNQPLTVKWQKVNYATSLAVMVSTDILDTSGYDYIGYDSEILPPDLTEYTIPGDIFSTTGDYSLSIGAYHGTPPGISPASVDSSKGYNIEKAGGLFMAATGFPTDIDSEGYIIQVGDAAERNSRKAVVDFTPREVLTRQYQKLVAVFR